jgi:hypothetical protein
LRKIRRLEKVFAVGVEEQWLDIIMSSVDECDIFGHSHLRIEKHSGELNGLLAVMRRRLRL